MHWVTGMSLLCEHVAGINCSDGCDGRVARHDVSEVESRQQEDIDRDDASRDAELQIAQLKTEVESLHLRLTERDADSVTIEDLRLRLEKQLSSHVAEISVSHSWYYVGQWDWELSHTGIW